MTTITTQQTGQVEEPRRFRLQLTPYMFILPALLFYVVFMFLPILATIVISFADWNGISLAQIEWVNVQNYLDLAEDPVFWQALTNNFILMVVGVPLNVAVSLFLAVLLEQGLRGSNFFRGVFFVPTIISMVVVGVVFTLILSPSLGLVNPLLEQIGLGDYARAWLGDPDTALYTVMLADLWKNFGLTMFLFVAGLKGIDQELYEAAIVDGASSWQSFWQITLPVLRPVLYMVIILTSIGSLKTFEMVYVMTFGGPNHASEVLQTWMYFNGFKFNKLGYGSAMANVILMITLALTIVQLRVFRADES